MKKILLTAIAAVVCCSTVVAQSVTSAVGKYVGDLYVSVGVPIDDETVPAPNSVVELQAGTDGTLTLSLSDFSFMGLNVGDILVPNVPVTTTDNGLSFGKNTPVELSLLDGQIQATAAINTESSISGDNLTAIIDVTWIQDGGFSAPIYVRFEGAKPHYQLPNGDFEGGYRENNSNQIPTGWNWFDNSTGNLGGTAANNSNVNIIADATGNNYVKVTEGSFIFIPVNGNLTTGIIHASSYTANDPQGNYNYSDPTEGIGQAFAGRPDSLSLRYAAYAKSADDMVQFKAVIHGAGRYQDPEGSADYSAIHWGTATFRTTRTVESADADLVLQQATIPFELGANAADIAPAAILASLSTNLTPGKGAKGDFIALDDIKFVYNSSLKAITIGGTPIEGFKKDTYVYYSTEKYDADAVVLEADGVGATVESAYDETTEVLTVTVKGNDYVINPDNVHTYTIHFGVPTGIEGVEAAPAAKTTGVYNLQGIKVADKLTDNLPKGIYIVNGQKHIVK